MDALHKRGASSGDVTATAVTSTIPNQVKHTFGAADKNSCLSRSLLGITYKQRVPYGVKQTEAYKKAKRQVRAAAKNARKMKESKGMLLEGRRSLAMSLMQNTGISWGRTFQVLKHLEMHQRANPPITNKLRNQIAHASEIVKCGK